MSSVSQLGEKLKLDSIPFSFASSWIFIVIFDHGMRKGKWRISPVDRIMMTFCSKQIKRQYEWKGGGEGSYVWFLFCSSSAAESLWIDMIGMMKIASLCRLWKWSHGQMDRSSIVQHHRRLTVSGGRTGFQDQFCKLNPPPPPAGWDFFNQLVTCSIK